jgi:hypothetical protein
MSSELTLALVVALLWGPTAAWLAIRVMRMSRDAPAPRPIVVSAESPVAHGPAEDAGARLAQAGYWICEACRSLNRPQAEHCYGCQAARPGVEAAGPRDPDATQSPARAEPETPAVSAAKAPARQRRPKTPAAPSVATPPLAACPLLGLPQDRSTRYDFPSPGNVCHAAPVGGVRAWRQRRFVAAMAGRRAAPSPWTASAPGA